MLVYQWIIIEQYSQLYKTLTRYVNTLHISYEIGKHKWASTTSNAMNRRKQESPCKITVFCPLGAFSANWSSVRISPPAFKMRPRAFSVTWRAQTWSQINIYQMYSATLVIQSVNGCICMANLKQAISSHKNACLQPYLQLWNFKDSGVICHSSNNNRCLVITTRLLHHTRLKNKQTVYYESVHLSQTAVWSCFSIRSFSSLIWLPN